MTQSKLNVFVVGVTGQQGGSVARLLSKNGHNVFGLVRDQNSEKAKKIAELGIKLVEGTFDDKDGLLDIMKKVDSVYIMTTPFESGPEGETKQGISMVDVAKEANVKHVVFSSVGNADKNTGVPHFDSKYAVEEHIKEIDLPYSIVRPVFFMENFLAPWMMPNIKEGNLAIAMPPDRKLQMIALENIAQFVTLVLENPNKFMRKAIDIASDEISNERAAKLFGEKLGVDVKYNHLNYESIEQMGEDMVKMYRWFNDVGYSVKISDLINDYPEIRWKKFEDWIKLQEL